MLVSVPLFGLAVTAQLIIALLLVTGSTLQCAACLCLHHIRDLTRLHHHFPPPPPLNAPPPPLPNYRYNVPKDYAERFDPIEEPVPGEAGKIKS